ncbi:hypothetical protein ABMA28_004006 [Loxostege sticticalis]|uniref:Uncharacterized protein n=1 Tax=Loxostege sticticalis TaxID=481309 RepID=A0ABD0SUA6_LOXSC
MTPDHKRNWKCQECYCKMPKVGNSNTPLRPKDSDVALEQSPSSENSNITFRVKNIPNRTMDISCSDILGDTAIEDNMERETINSGMITNLTLQNISEVIAQKLKENNQNIVLQIQTTIQAEISKAINELRNELNQETNIIKEKDKQRKIEIEKLNNKIEKLKNENESLKNEMNELGKKITSTAPINDYYAECNSKRIVLHGLSELYRESESDLHNRIVTVFRDIMNVDLTGYIEDFYRIGRNKTMNRPLVIELISKRMTKYLVNNNYYFKKTGLLVTEFLDRAARMERKKIWEQVLTARKKGLHAVIKNNKLYVDGKPYTHESKANETAKTPAPPQTRVERRKTDHSEETKCSKVKEYSFRNPRTTV